jgi:hypothetical protein
MCFLNTDTEGLEFKSPIVILLRMIIRREPSNPNCEKLGFRRIRTGFAGGGNNRTKFTMFQIQNKLLFTRIKAYVNAVTVLESTCKARVHDQGSEGPRGTHGIGIWLVYKTHTVQDDVWWAEVAGMDTDWTGTCSSHFNTIDFIPKSMITLRACNTRI